MAPPTSAQFHHELETLSDSAFLSKWILERVPYVFTGQDERYRIWRHSLASDFDVPSWELHVVGSAAAGRSLNPAKNLSSFSSHSDIDVAIVSSRYFDEGWRWMRGLGSSRHRLPERAKQWLKDHEKRLVYWGMIASDQILEHLPFGPRWIPRMLAAAQEAPIDNREIKVRIYRDFGALDAYLKHSISQLKRQPLSPYSD